MLLDAVVNAGHFFVFPQAVTRERHVLPVCCIVFIEGHWMLDKLIDTLYPSPLMRTRPIKSPPDFLPRIL